MWAIIARLVLGLALSAVAYFLNPPQEPPKVEKNKTWDIPKPNDGEENGIVHGTTWVTPKVHWYGDTRADDIKSDGGGGKK